MVNGALRAGAAVLCAALLAFPEEAPAQARRTAVQAERAHASALQEAARARTEARAAQTDIAALDARLADAAARRAEAEAAATAAQSRLRDLEAKAELGAAAFARDRAQVEALVIAALFAERGQSATALPGAGRAAAFVRAAGPAFTARAAGRARILGENRALQADIVEERQILAEAQAAIEAERAGVEALRAARGEARTTLLADASAADRRARTYAAEARSLRELAQRVQPARRQNAAARLPARPLGALRAPVSGELILGYGQRSPAGHAASGLTYRTAPAAAVIAPAAGTIGYAGLFRSYGQILILNLDNGYVLVLAGLETVNARVGQSVSAGQSVGRMPQTASPAPELYVEVRQDGRPIDPSRQLAPRTTSAANARAG